MIAKTKIKGVYVNSDGQVWVLKDGQFVEQKIAHTQKGYEVFYRRGVGTVYVHRLVYETFIGDIVSGMVIDHIDEDKQNNALWNLQLLTQSDNLKKHYAIVRGDWI